MNNPDLDTRTWLAGLAMQALAPTWQDCSNAHAEQCAKNAVAYADALLTALAKDHPQQAEAKLPEMAEQSQRHIYCQVYNPDRDSFVCTHCGKQHNHPNHL